MSTFGAKAFHFSHVFGNQFKAITELNFKSLEKGSILFISFGEIDCRPDEGFISASKKLNVSLEEMILETVENYVNWFSILNKNYGHNLFFFNLPAPTKVGEHSEKVNEQVSKSVNLFNTALKKKLADFDFNLIDVFSATVNPQGFSNGIYHIDRRHLGPSIIEKIESQLYYSRSHKSKVELFND